MVDGNVQRIQNITATNELTVQFENRLRQELGIGDTRDPVEFAGGLLRNYSDVKEALELEEVGLPFTQVKVIAPNERDTGSTNREVDKAIDNVERDLQTLSRDALLKDIDIELQAWGTAIRAIMAEGLKAADFALDPRERDRAFAARRALGNYARLARYVGALTKGANQSYRQLAQSLDVVASLILVVMGEALAQAGARAEQFLLQAPAADLQERRDAVIEALRSLIGRHEGAGADGWPRGTEAYRQLVARLADAGHADLRGLLREETMSQMLNQFVDVASGNDPVSLRGLAATADILLERFRRLILFGQHSDVPQSPQLTTFLSSLLLFLHAFENNASGSRLLHIARPAILSYGLYGIGETGPGVERLRMLVVKRGDLAEQADCYMSCDCDEDHVGCQILLDKLVYDVDRAIDLYTLGVAPDGDGPAEQRAAAYSYIMSEFRKTTIGSTACVTSNDKVDTILDQLEKVLQKAPQTKPRMLNELCLQYRGEDDWEALVRRLAPSCRQPTVFESPIVKTLLERAINSIGGDPSDCRTISIELPATVQEAMDKFAGDYWYSYQ